MSDQWLSIWVRAALAAVLTPVVWAAGEVAQVPDTWPDVWPGVVAVGLVVVAWQVVAWAEGT